MSTSKNRKLLEETSEITRLRHYSIQKFGDTIPNLCSFFGLMPTFFSLRMRPSKGKKHKYGAPRFHQYCSTNRFPACRQANGFVPHSIDQTLQKNHHRRRNISKGDIYQLTPIG